MAGGGPKRPSWVRISGIGFEFAAAVAGFTAIGWWIDRKYETGPLFVLIGVGLGLVGGMYNLIRESLHAARDAGREQKKSPKREDSTEVDKE